MRTSSVMFQRVFLAGLMLGSLIAGPADGALAWQTTFLERGQSVGTYASAALFPPDHSTLANRPAVSYYDSLNTVLRFAWFDGVQWNIVVVDGQEGVGTHCSLAFHPSGQPAISYYDAVNTRVKYAQHVGDDLLSGWSIEEVDNDGNLGQYTSLAILPDGQPGISYRVSAPAGDVKYAKRGAGGTWATVVVADTGPTIHATSLRVQPSGAYAGRPAIAYFDSSQSDLKFAYFDGAAWQLCPVDITGDVGRWCSLAFLPSGQAAISYRDETNDSLKYAFHSGADLCSGWTSATVDNEADVGNYTSLAILPAGAGASACTGFDGAVAGGAEGGAVDLSGQPVISYFDNTSDDLKFAWFDGRQWSNTAVDTEKNGEYTSVVIPPDTGQPVILYYESGNYGNLKCAAFAGFGWSIERVDTARRVGECTSVVFLPSGCPAVSYKANYPEYDCKFAWRDAAGWQRVIVDATYNSGDYSSMKVFSPENPVELRRGQPAVAYRNSDLRDDWFAWHEGNDLGADWRTERATNASYTGEYVSLGIFPDNHPTLPGRPAVSYRRNGPLGFSWEDPVGDSVWPFVVVDNEGGNYTSLAFLPSGRPAISYSVDTNRDLKYAEFKGTDLANPDHWCKVLVDEDAYSGSWTSLAIVGGQPAIAYASTDTSTLKYAWCTGGDCCQSANWRSAIVDVTSIAAFASMTVLPSGQPAISYFDDTADDLKFTWHTGGDYTSGWKMVSVDTAGDVGRWSSLAVGPGSRVAISYFDETRDSLKFAESYPADCDFDGDVDSEDLDGFTACASGPDLPLQPGCGPWDFDFDGDVDQSDFGIFQRCYSGPNVPANPNCAN